MRRAVQEMIFPNKTFSWIRHIAIAVILLTLINMLVIFAPNILGIFGIIGEFFYILTQAILVLATLSTSDSYNLYYNYTVT